MRGVAQVESFTRHAHESTRPLWLQLLCFIIEGVGFGKAVIVRSLLVDAEIAVPDYC